MIRPRWSSCFLQTSIRTPSTIGGLTDGKRRRIVTQSLLLALARRYCCWPACKLQQIKKLFQMGMISVAGAPILNSKNGTRRASFIKTKDQEMMKSRKKTWNSLISSKIQAITVDRIQRLVTDTPKIHRKTFFMANMEQDWKHVDSVAWVILLTTAFECLIEGNPMQQCCIAVHLTLADCHFCCHVWLSGWISLNSEIIQAWLSRWRCRMTSVRDFLSYLRCFWKWSL